MSNQPNVMIVKSTKNEGLAVILGLVFGPLGLLYSSLVGGAVMFVITIPVALLTLGFGLLLINPICAGIAYFAAKSYNEKLMAASSAPATTPAQSQSKAA